LIANKAIKTTKVDKSKMPIGGISFLTGRINGLVIECNIDVRGLFCPGRKAASQLIITSAIIANIKMLISWLVRPNIVGIISEANKSFFPTRRLAATNSINFSTNINKIAEVSTPPMLGINLRRGVRTGLVIVSINCENGL
jgi:hypothetical protein